MTSAREEAEKVLLRYDRVSAAGGYGAGDHRLLADALRALLAETEPEWEYGVEYEVNAERSVYTAAHSEEMARKWVAESPTDTGLRRRRKAGPWEEVTE